jgi:TfoX/Sxy family transcriptional regulator of competence genes
LKIPPQSEAAQKFFRALLPSDQRVIVRPMFGNTSAFVNGNMFFGVYGDDILVRLSEGDAKELMANKGASPFEPMKGRIMKSYFLVPRAWRKDQLELTREWVKRSFEWAAKLPPKKPKK